MCPQFLLKTGTRMNDYGSLKELTRKWKIAAQRCPRGEFWFLGGSCFTLEQTQQRGYWCATRNTLSVNLTTKHTSKYEAAALRFFCISVRDAIILNPCFEYINVCIYILW